MKRAIFAQTGTPAERITLEEIPVPEPKAGEVRIKVLAANIIPADIMFIKGTYGVKPHFPASPAGYEGVGIIDQVGEGVPWELGIRVCFYTTEAGAWADYCLVKSYACLPVPEAYDDARAAQLFVNPFAAVGLLHASNVKPGEYLLINAAASAVSKIIIQLAQVLKIKIIGTIRDEEATNVHLLKELGPLTIINTNQEVLTERVDYLTGGNGVSAALDAIGGEAGRQILRCIAPGGNLQVYGEFSEEPTCFSNMDLLFSEVIIKGFKLGAWLTVAENVQQANTLLSDFISTGKITLHVEATYPLNDISQALRHFDQPHRQGKIIVCP